MTEKKKPKCEYCDKEASIILHVCEDHIKVLDRIASRREKK